MGGQAGDGDFEGYAQRVQMRRKPGGERLDGVQGSVGTVAYECLTMRSVVDFTAPSVIRLAAR